MFSTRFTNPFKQAAPAELQPNGEIRAGVRQAETACAELARLQAQFGMRAGIFIRARFVELPVEFADDLLVWKNLCFAVAQEKDVIGGPVGHRWFVTVHPGGHLIEVGKRPARINPAGVIANVNAFLFRSGVVAGGGCEGFGLAGPVVDQEFCVVAIEVFFVVLGQPVAAVDQVLQSAVRLKGTVVSVCGIQLLVDRCEHHSVPFSAGVNCKCFSIKL